MDEDENEDNEENELAAIIGQQEITPIRKITPLNPEEEDFEFARRHMKETIEKGSMALDELLDIAQQSGHPRAFEVMTMHFKNVIEANRQLMETKRTDQQIKSINVRGEKPDVLNQNVFVGSTAELQRMLDLKDK